MPYRVEINIPLIIWIIRNNSSLYKVIHYFIRPTQILTGAYVSSVFYTLSERQQKVTNRVVNCCDVTSTFY